MGDEWYYAKNGQQQGPVSTEVLTRLASSGQVQPNDLVWSAGMPNWAPARTVRAIFPETPQVVPVPVEPVGGYALSPEPAPQPATIPYEPSAPRPDEPDDTYWDRPRPRRRRGNPALVIAGISVGVLLLVGVIVLLIVLLRPGNPRSFNLATNEKYDCHVEFKAGQKAQIWVKSDQDSDVDLFIFDSAGREVRRDDGPSKDCYIEFIPQRTERFKIEVWNRFLQAPPGAPPHIRQMVDMRNRSNRCTLKWSPP
jgi:hypothetical protein